MVYISDDDILKGYEYVLKHKSGQQSDLEKINKELSTYFSMLGFVSFGIDSKDERRYQVTNGAEKLIKIALSALRSKNLHEEYSDIFA